MFPQEGVGDGMPAPKKLNVASYRMRFPTLNDAITVIVPTVPGNMWRAKIRVVDAPEILANATKLLSFSTNTSALTLRTNETQATKIIKTIIVW